MKNDYLENKHQREVNKARGQGYGGVRYSSNYLFDFQRIYYRGELLLLLTQMQVLLVVWLLK
jgi:hypothetical protein